MIFKKKENFETINLPKIDSSGNLPGLEEVFLDSSGNLPDGYYFITFRNYAFALQYDENKDNDFTKSDGNEIIKGILQKASNISFINKTIFKITSNQLYTPDSLWTFSGTILQKYYGSNILNITNTNAAMYPADYISNSGGWGKMYPFYQLIIYSDYTIQSMLTEYNGFLNSSGKLVLHRLTDQKGKFKFFKVPQYSGTPYPPQQLINLGNINVTTNNINDAQKVNMSLPINPGLYYIKFLNDNRFLGIKNDYNSKKNNLVPMDSILDSSSNYFYIDKNSIINTYDFNTPFKYPFTGFMVIQKPTVEEWRYMYTNPDGTIFDIRYSYPFIDYHPWIYSMPIEYLSGPKLLKIKNNGYITMEYFLFDKIFEPQFDTNGKMQTFTCGINSDGFLDSCGNNFAQFELYYVKLPDNYQINTNTQIDIVKRSKQAMYAREKLNIPVSPEISIFQKYTINRPESELIKYSAGSSPRDIYLYSSGDDDRFINPSVPGQTAAAPGQTTPPTSPTSPTAPEQPSAPEQTNINNSQKLKYVLIGIGGFIFILIIIILIIYLKK